MNRRKKTSGMRCSVRFCKNRTAEKNVSFFNYPLDIERRASWIRNCETYQRVSFNPKLQNSARVCGEHFEKRMFLNSQSRNRLVFNAVPTLFNDEILALRENSKKTTIYNELITDEDIKIDDTEFDDYPNSSIESSLDTAYDSSPTTADDSCLTSDEFPKCSLNQIKIESFLNIASEEQRIQQLENAVINLSRQLIVHEGVKNVLDICEKYLSPELLTMVKINMPIEIKKEEKYCELS